METILPDLLVDLHRLLPRRPTGRSGGPDEMVATAGYVAAGADARANRSAVQPDSALHHQSLP
jgi:hypothetical protein